MWILCIFSSSGPKNKLRYCHHLCSSSINHFNIFLTNYKLLFFVDYNLTVYCWVGQLVGSRFFLESLCLFHGRNAPYTVECKICVILINRKSKMAATVKEISTFINTAPELFCSP